MDIVWWIDKFPPKKEFTKRVGLNTYMISGTNKVVRYYPYFNKAMNMTKNIISSIGYFDRQ